MPFQVTGKAGSVSVTLKPAPRGIALAVAKIPRHVLRLAGIGDVWGFSKGHTKTTVNYALASFDALKQTAKTKITKAQVEELHIVTGPIEELITEELVPVVEEESKEEAEGEPVEKKEADEEPDEAEEKKPTEEEKEKKE